MGGEEIDSQLWRELFDLRLEVSEEHGGDGLDLIDVARYGHVTNSALPWEQVRFAVESSAAPYLRAV